MNLLTLVYLSVFGALNAAVIDLTSNNIQTVLDSHELVLIDFYASWCYFSNILDPIFTETSNKIDDEYKSKNQVAFAKLDCEKESGIAKQYGIRKYPTLKLFRYGEVSKREYRGARNVAAFLEFIKDQLEDPIKYIKDGDNADRSGANLYITGHYKEKSGASFDLFHKVAYQFRDECLFYVKLSPEITEEKLVFESKSENPVEFHNINDSVEMKNWITKSCTPLVRNITFQNAEEITEEGRPLILLFYDPKHPAITVKYSKFVTDHLISERNSVNFVYGDGHQFAHPLMHLGKSEHDLPLIAVDSFQHMFLLSKSVNEALEDPEILRKFIADLNSGKLHREFHNGPDPDTSAQNQPSASSHDDNSHDGGTTPIPSVFKKLRPNANRYSIHDEF